MTWEAGREAHVYKPSPRDATSVAIRIGAFPERNSERKEPILVYLFQSHNYA